MWTSSTTTQKGIDLIKSPIYSFKNYQFQKGYLPLIQEKLRMFINIRLYLYFKNRQYMEQNGEDKEIVTKRPPEHRQSQPLLNNKPQKRHKKLKQNPFDDLKLYDEQEMNKKQQNKNNQQWIKPKTTPLTISVCDHSKINKYYSHKSLQKYIKYVCVKNCPNPLWLSIKRQSQIQHIVFIDVQIENNLFYKAFNGTNTPDDNNMLNFLPKYNKPSLKAIFKQTPFLKQSSEVWDALFVYDHEAIKQQSQSTSNIKDLPQKLTDQILKNYSTYILNQNQRKYNLYPMPELPAYKQYYIINSESFPQRQIPLKNKILVIDCQMVMNGVNFQLARTSIMNFEGQLIYDQFFKPDVITNYNTQFSGITEDTLKNVTKKIPDLHKDLQNILTKDTILVGHSLQNDLHAMKLIHQRVIDTSVLYSRRNGSKMKLKTLAFQILNRSIQIGSHCSEQDCRATLQLMRHKIEGSQEVQLMQNKIYHLLDQLKSADKKIVLIDNDLEFIKHRKQYIDIEFQQTDNNPGNRDKYIAKFAKYSQKNVKNADLIFSRIRKTNQQEWQSYYKGIDSTIQHIYQKSLNRTVFFINFQVNNSYEVFPQELQTLPERKRPFCIIIVKDQ